MQPDVRNDTLSTLHRFVRWIFGRVMPPLAYPVLQGPLKGARFVLGAAAGEGGGASVYVNRVEPAKTQALLSVLRPGQVVIDVGANIGYYTILASRRVGRGGRVIACEPFTRNVHYLHRHIHLNGAANVAVIPAACSDREGLSRFDPGRDCAEGRLVANGDEASEAVEFVPTVTIDEIVRQSRVRPDVLKVDVEGAEEQVLRGASETLRAAHPIVLLGVHSDALRRVCTSMLASFGYADPIVCEEKDGDTELLFMPPVNARPSAMPAGKAQQG